MAITSPIPVLKLTSIYRQTISSIVRNIAFIDWMAFHSMLTDQMRLPLITADAMNINLLGPNSYAYVTTFVNDMLKSGLSPFIMNHIKMNIANVIIRFPILNLTLKFNCAGKFVGYICIRKTLT